MTIAAEPLEVLTMGRVGVDLYPDQIGVGLEDVTTFRKYLGGTATNVAVAAARHGRRSAVITRTGDDPFGALHPPGICATSVSTTASCRPVPGLPTPVTFCEIFPPDDFPLYFYRVPERARPPDPCRRARPRRDRGGRHLLGHRRPALCRSRRATATMAALKARAGVDTTA